MIEKPNSFSRQSEKILNSDLVLLNKGSSTFLIEGSLYKELFESFKNKTVEKYILEQRN